MSKDIRQINDSQKSECTKSASDNEDIQLQREQNSRPLRKSAFIVGDSMIKKVDGYLVTSSISYKYIEKVIPFVAAKTVDMHDRMKLMQRNFQSNVYIWHVGTNELPTNMAPEEISEKVLPFLNI